MLSMQKSSVGGLRFGSLLYISRWDGVGVSSLVFFFTGCCLPCPRDRIAAPMLRFSNANSPAGGNESVGRPSLCVTTHLFFCFLFFFSFNFLSYPSCLCVSFLFVDWGQKMLGML